MPTSPAEETPVSPLLIRSIPIGIRRQLDLKAGDTVVWRIEDGKLVLAVKDRPEAKILDADGPAPSRAERVYDPGNENVS